MSDQSQPPLTDSPSLSYKDAGVDIDAGNALVERISAVAKKTRRSEVMAGLGGFGALCQLPAGYREPVLVAGTDGVGTKLKLAIELNRHDDIGVDLVAMCVNDLVVAGAEPLMFLDYYATGKLDVDTAAAVIAGIGRGCELAGCSLVGGETAEMPGMYTGGDYDLAGFCVGVVEKSGIVDGSNVRGGDVLIGLPASGPHSNGYSLIRKIIERSDADLQQLVGGQSLADALLMPTRIYAKPLLRLLKNLPVSSLCHITGGGLLENLPRVLPTGTRATVDLSSWQQPQIFEWLREQGNVERREMFRTFNCGVGMVVCVHREDVKEALQLLSDQGEKPWVMGSIELDRSDTRQVVLDGL